MLQQLCNKPRAEFAFNKASANIRRVKRPLEPGLIHIKRVFALAQILAQEEGFLAERGKQLQMVSSLMSFYRMVFIYTGSGSDNRR